METQQPSYIMDLMALCWAQQPRDRPSASQLVSIASAPEFTHLYDVLPLESAGGPVLCACPAPPSALPMLHAVPSPHVTSPTPTGCVVYHWEAKSRTILNCLDCSKLVPCSESLKSISIEEHLSPGRCQVTSMAVVGSGELYIGTIWGCIVVAERRTMRPITVFRPYEEEVRVIMELNLWPSLQSIHSPVSSASSSSFNQSQERCPLVVTVGRGYRSLMGRYTDFALPATPDDVAQDDRGDGSKRCSSYVLLWAAGEQWAPL